MHHLALPHSTDIVEAGVEGHATTPERLEGASEHSTSLKDADTLSGAGEKHTATQSGIAASYDDNVVVHEGMVFG
jgi:hypothetical protein